MRERFEDEEKHFFITDGRDVYTEEVQVEALPKASLAKNVAAIIPQTKNFLSNALLLYGLNMVSERSNPITTGILTASLLSSFRVIPKAESTGVSISSAISSNPFPDELQEPSAYFMKILDSGSDEYGMSIVQANNGDYIFTGRTGILNDQACDILVERLSSNGTIIWSKVLDISVYSYGRDISLTDDDGVLLVGKVAEPASSPDVLLARFFSNGTLSWAKALSGVLNDHGAALTRINQNDWAFTGVGMSYASGSHDLILARFTDDGTLKWFRSMGGIGLDLRGHSLTAANNSDLIVTGGKQVSYSGNWSLLLTRFSSNGTHLWTKELENAHGYSVSLTTDERIIVAGQYYFATNDVLFAQFNSDGTMNWVKLLDGGEGELAYSMRPMQNGGFIATGWTNSFNPIPNDLLLAEFSNNGTLVWAKVISNINNEQGYSVCQTIDGGFTTVGVTDSFGANDLDILFTHFDSTGNIPGCTTIQDVTLNMTARTLFPSEKSFSPIVKNISPIMRPLSIIATDKNYTAKTECEYFPPTNTVNNTLASDTSTISSSTSNDISLSPLYFKMLRESYTLGVSAQLTSKGDVLVSGPAINVGAGGTDLLLTRFAANGTLIRTKTLGGSLDDSAQSLHLVDNDGAFVNGYTYSYGAGGADVLLARFNADDDVIWTKTLGGAQDDIGTFIQGITGGGAYIGGRTTSFSVGTDSLITRVDVAGNVMWAKAIGGIGYSNTLSLQVTSDESVFFMGYTDGFGVGMYDIFLGRLASNGTLLWMKTIGGGNDDIGRGLCITADDVFVVGETKSFGVGGFDAFLGRFTTNGTLIWARTLGGTANNEKGERYPRLTFDGGIIATGYTKSFGAGNADFLLSRFSINGTLDWAKALGGWGNDFGNSVNIMPNGDVLATGGADSYGYGGAFIIARFDAEGNIPGCSVLDITQDMIVALAVPTVMTVTPTVQDVNLTVMDWDITTVEQSIPLQTHCEYFQTDASSSSSSNTVDSSFSSSNSQSSSSSVVSSTISASSSVSPSLPDPLYFKMLKDSWTIGDSVQITSDGGVLITGQTTGVGSGGIDLFLTKFTANGTLAWIKTLGDSVTDVGHDLQLTSDGGAFVTGYTHSYGAGGADFLLARLVANGNLTWAKTFGGIEDDIGFSVQVTTDGGAYVGGITYSFGASPDILVARFDADGSLMWAKALGGTGDDSVLSLQVTPDDSVFVTGYTTSFGAGMRDLFLARFGGDGILSWMKTVGGGNDDFGRSLRIISNDEVFVMGETKSFGAGNTDILLGRFTSNGTLGWAKTLGGGAHERPGFTFQLTSNDEIVATGSTKSVGAGAADLLLTRFSVNGSLTWAKALGGSGDDYGNSVCMTPDDGIFVTGGTGSYGYGAAFLIARFDAEGNIPGCSVLDITQDMIVALAVPTVMTVTPTVQDVNLTVMDWDITTVEQSIPLQTHCEYFQTDASSSSSSNTVDSSSSSSNSQSSSSSVVSSTFSTSSLISQSSSRKYLKVFGGSGDEVGIRGHLTSDGGSLVTSWSDSFGGWRMLLTKLDMSGDLVWSSTFGSTGDVVGLFHESLHDNEGGAFLTGWTSNFGAGQEDSVFARLNASGDLLWAKTLGGSGWDKSYSLCLSGDDAMFIAGSGNSFGAGQQDVLISKFNKSGEWLWSKSVGESDEDWTHSISTATNGDILMTGGTRNYGAGYWGDLWIARFNATANLKWGKALGGSNEEGGKSMLLDDNDGIFVSGYTKSFGAGQHDFLLTKFNETGALVLSKAYGGTGSEEAYSIHQASDGNIFLAGGTTSFGANPPSADFLVLKVNSTGELIWGKTIGGADRDVATSIYPTNDNGFCVVGDTNNFGAVGRDILFARLDENGTIPGCTAIRDVTADIIVTPLSLTARSITPIVQSINPTVQDWPVSAVPRTLTMRTECEYFQTDASSSSSSNTVDSSSSSSSSLSDTSLQSQSSSDNAVSSTSIISRSSNSFSNTFMSSYLINSTITTNPLSITSSTNKQTTLLTQSGIISKSSSSAPITSMMTSSFSGSFSNYSSMTDSSNINHPPVLVHSIPDKIINVDEPFELIFNENMFVDADQDVLRYWAVLKNNITLPGWLAFNAEHRQFLGTPSDQDVGTITIKLVATDEKATAEDGFNLSVQKVPIYLSPTVLIIAGSIIPVCLIPILLYCCRKRFVRCIKNEPALMDSDEESTMEDLIDLDDFRLKPIVISARMQMRTFIGEKYYEMTKIHKKEAVEIEEQIGLKISFAESEKEKRFSLGHGNFGSIKVAFRKDNGEYVASKKIKGDEDILKSKEEADIQRAAAGKNVLPIYNTIELRHTLYHFMPLAGLGNARNIQKLLSYADEELMTQALTIIAKDILTGLKTCHQKGYCHLDVKPENIVLTKEQGIMAYITDFGCAKKVDDPMFPMVSHRCIGDNRYFSPERYEATLKRKAFRADKSDAWAAGLTLLELAKNEDVFRLLKIPTEAIDRFSKCNRQFFRDKFSKIKQLNDVNRYAIFDVIKGLLQPCEEGRLTVSEALEFPCFYAIDYMAREGIISNLESCKEEKEKKQDKKDSVVTEAMSYRAFPVEKRKFYSHKNHQKYYLMPEHKRKKTTLAKDGKEEKGRHHDRDKSSASHSRHDNPHKFFAPQKSTVEKQIGENKIPRRKI